MLYHCIVLPSISSAGSQNIHIYTRIVIGNSEKVRALNGRECMKHNLNSRRKGCANQITILGGGMDIFQITYTDFFEKFCYIFIQLLTIFLDTLKTINIKTFISSLYINSKNWAGLTFLTFLLILKTFRPIERNSHIRRMC